MIDLLQGTVKARLSSFMDALFDPTIGLFSIQRDLEPKIDGYQSVFTAFGDTLDILVGSNGILENLSRLLGFAGKDPMRSLYDGINALNSYLLSVSGALAQMKKLSTTDIGSGVGKFLAQATNLVFDGLLSAIAGSSGGLIGGLIGGIGGLLGSVFSHADGFIPASGGLIGALASEAARKPPDSDFVIANSTEAILTPKMLGNLTGNLIGAGGSKTVNFQPGAIVFNLPSSTPQEIAMAAIAIIENALTQELETRIA